MKFFACIPAAARILVIFSIMPYALVVHFLSRCLALYAYPVVTLPQHDRCPDSTVHLVCRSLAYLLVVDIQCQAWRVCICLYVHDRRVTLRIPA